MIHSTAIISKDAKIGKDVTVGPYSVIEDNVVIGDNCHIDTHVKIARYTTIGNNTRVYKGALIGEEPQDHSFVPGVVSYTEIGHNTVIREYVTIHRSPVTDVKTIVGNHCLLMAFVHLGHDTVLHDRVTIANNTLVAGHVVIETGAVISANVGIHQFCKIGALSMTAPFQKLVQDIAPYCMVVDNAVQGPNVIGMKRSNISPEVRKKIKQTIKTFFFKDLNVSNALKVINKEFADCEEVKHFIQFAETSKRGIISGK